MPTYQYACTECGDQLEVVQRFSDDPLTVCTDCGGRLRKVYSPVGIVFKGSGFYRNDSRTGSMSGAPANGNGKSGSEKSAGSEAAASGKSESGAKAGSDPKSGSDGSSSGSSGAKTASGAGSAGSGSKVA